jgi:hypothetical protein
MATKRTCPCGDDVQIIIDRGVKRELALCVRCSGRFDQMWLK